MYNPEGNIFLTMLIFAVVPAAVLCSTVAYSKHRSAAGWFFLGLAFNLLALIAVAGIAPLNPKQSSKLIAFYAGDGGKPFRICPYCLEATYVDAKRCAHCGSDLPPLPPPPAIK